MGLSGRSFQVSLPREGVSFLMWIKNEEKGQSIVWHRGALAFEGWHCCPSRTSGLKLENRMEGSPPGNAVAWHTGLCLSPPALDASSSATSNLFIPKGNSFNQSLSNNRVSALGWAGAGDLQEAVSVTKIQDTATALQHQVQGLVDTLQGQW